MKEKFITVVCGLPINKEGQFLLSQRHAPETAYSHGKWQLIGGGLEPGETPEQTLKREFLEETKLRIKVLWPKPLVKNSVWLGAENKQPYDLHVTLIAFISQVGLGEPDWSADEETADVRWFTLEDALKLDVLPHTHEFLTEAQALILQHQLQPR